MGSKGGGQTSSQTVQSNEPPAWAKPLLEKSASQAMALYDAGMGYNVYEGPTQANMSRPTLSGMNSLLARTGYNGPRVQNQTAEQQFPQLFKMFEEQQKKKDDFAASQPSPGSGGSDLTGWHQVMNEQDALGFEQMRTALQNPQVKAWYDSVSKNLGGAFQPSSYYMNAPSPFSGGAWGAGQQMVFGGSPQQDKQLPDWGNPMLRGR